jgi:hypothetical protein
VSDPNSPPANTFSGWVSGLFGGNVGPPTGVGGVNAGGGSASSTPSQLGSPLAMTKDQYYGPGAGVSAGLGATTKAQYYAAPTAPTAAKSKPAAAKKPAALDAHQLHLRHLATLAAQAKKAPAPAPKAVTKPVTHTTTAGTTKAKTPAGSAAGNATSPVAGLTKNTEIALVFAGVFVIFVFLARRKKRR